jgi:hypothetical protein
MSKEAISVSAGHRKRLRPGELDGIVLSYLCQHKKDGPLTASAVGKGIKRSPGAVANCLARLAKAKKVGLAKKAPRAYAAKVARAR